MGLIDTLMSFEYDRTHSDAVYEPPPAVKTDKVPSNSSRSRHGSKMQAAVQSEVNELSVSDTSLRRSQSQEEKGDSLAATSANRASPGAKGVPVRMGPERIGNDLDKPPVSAFVNSSLLPPGLLLLGLALSIWYFAF